MRNRYLLGAGVALAVALSWADAQAQLFAAPAGPGAWYFGGEGGWTNLDSQSGRTNLGNFPVKTSFDTGFNVGARAGYEWGPWRFEEEFRYQQNGRTNVNIAGFNLGVNGDRNAYAIMSNLIYDFSLGYPITPHIGAGIGAVGLREGVNLRNSASVVDNTQWEFGYQAIAGIRYNIATWVRRIRPSGPDLARSAMARVTARTASWRA
jgi:opacity protein-like surface antigen